MGTRQAPRHTDTSHHCRRTAISCRLPLECGLIVCAVTSEVTHIHSDSKVQHYLQELEMVLQGSCPTLFTGHQTAVCREQTPAQEPGLVWCVCQMRTALHVTGCTEAGLAQSFRHAGASRGSKRLENTSMADTLHQRMPGASARQEEVAIHPAVS